MMRKKAKYGVGLVLILGILFILMTTTFRSSLQYYVTVSELLADNNKYQSKILKIAGQARGIQKIQTEDSLLYQFMIHEGGQEISVRYTGMVPDTFKDQAQVVVTGQFINGSFNASHILAKCASKYESRLATPDGSLEE